MATTEKTKITVEALVKAPMEKVWKNWNEPKHIMQWCNASDDWHAPHAENDLRENGKFTTTMAAKDKSMSFDFGGVYTTVEDKKKIAYTMGDGRKVSINFSDEGNAIRITETFEAEDQNEISMQKDGWQAILNNFKKYTEKG